jgi:hypothetical protein
MQATLSASHCAKPTSTGGADDDEDTQPTMYLVSPFYGVSGYAMVFGNIALVLLCFGCHAIFATCCETFCRRRSGENNDAAVADILARYRFPNVSMQAAVYAVQGVAFGGWRLLWNVITSGENDGGGVGTSVGSILTWLVSMLYPAAVLLSFWKIRSSLLLHRVPHSIVVAPIGVAALSPNFLSDTRAVCSRPLLPAKRNYRPTTESSSLPQ